MAEGTSSVLYGGRRTRLGRTARQRTVKSQTARVFASDHGEVIADSKFDKFRDWLRLTGFPKTKLTLANFRETGRGMMATKDIEEGEVIVSVPEKHLITYRSVSKSYGTDHGLNSHQLLALHVALQRQFGTRSSWYPYFDMLPADFNTIAVMYEDKLEALLPRCVQEEVASQRTKIKASFAAVSDFLKTNCQLLPSPSSSLTFKDFEWAWLCVNTRCIFLDKKDDAARGGNIALAPMLDFLNHSWEARIQGGFDAATKCYQIRTLTPYKKGQQSESFIFLIVFAIIIIIKHYIPQVFINYGPHDNFFILKEYGFVIPRNPYNYVSLDSEFTELRVPSETNVAKEHKLGLLKERGFLGLSSRQQNKNRDYTLRPNDISFRLLCALRLRVLASFEHPTTFAAWEKVVMGQCECIDERNERETFECLQTMCHDAIERAGKALEVLGSDDGILRSSSSPLSVMFVRQIWQESRDIATGVLEEIRHLS
ncbi:hypothetical protein BC937DRAFT_93499 [Endogone sp. FLAS-F59071]|nr:hypothetical protein BC937DRAFT_93499 [Endogone sp. FLAS-F59071]|eukprot:RUS14658.1 hypothetical protein BC937DRAFT_93499 [Endogone sp. FLAS-F59071]